MPNPFRFSVQESKAPLGSAWRDYARKAEDLGFSTLHMPDHFVNEEFALVPAMAAAAAVTDTLRVGALVHGNDYRHPAMLAKEAATVDLLSDGRLEFGIGAGWQRTDYEAIGMEYDRPGLRIDRLEESIAIIKGLWGDGPFSFEGEHYRITELDGFPKPAQDPRPPVLIGAGAQRMLRLAAREADIVAFNFSLAAGEVSPEAGLTGTAEATREKLEWVRDEAGDRFDDLELQCAIFFVTVTDDAEGMFEAMAPAFGLDPETAKSIPHVLIGTEEQMIERLQQLREEYGFSYFSFPGDTIDSVAPVVAKLVGT